MEEDRLAIPLYRPYRKLVEITILGQKFSVPENNLLLRCFQFLCPDTVPYGRYCWNEECQYCRVTVKRPGTEKVQQVISCKLLVEEGLEVQELSAELRWNLSRLLHPDREPSPPEDDSNGQSDPAASQA
ncbi:MAG: hypothetical protein HY647_07705 [Acidobacteria bacterium]|nr:hypothetical protein [Acidobacteriota bacterium]